MVNSSRTLVMDYIWRNTIHETITFLRFVVLYLIYNTPLRMILMVFFLVLSIWIFILNIMLVMPMTQVEIIWISPIQPRPYIPSCTHLSMLVEYVLGILPIRRVNTMLWLASSPFPFRCTFITFMSILILIFLSHNWITITGYTKLASLESICDLEKCLDNLS